MKGLEVDAIVQTIIPNHLIPMLPIPTPNSKRSHQSGLLSTRPKLGNPKPKEYIKEKKSALVSVNFHWGHG